MPGMATDPQFSPEILLRPFAGFEAIYQGVVSTTPLLFSEYVTGTAADATDAEAGRNGISTKLVKGISVPLGARVQIWLPSVLNREQSDYSWQIVWRLRSPGDAQQQQVPFHLRSQSYGATDTIPATGGPRIILPAAYETLIYPATEPLTANGRASSNLRIDEISPRADSLPLPLLPGALGTGYYQQGVLDPLGTLPFGAYGGVPSYNSFFTNAKGDELILGVHRASGGAAWGFGGGDPDELLSLLFGVAGGPLPDVGIYVSIGTAP